MDLPVDSQRLTGCTDPITVWDAKRLAQFRRDPNSIHLFRVIDEMGKESRVAQGLNAVLSSVGRLTDNPSYRLYLLCSDRKCLGIMKVGVKKLFIRNKSGKLFEIEPLCVLDFYVHESQQRSGYGRLLFDFMLHSEQVAPWRLGIDRPSPKLLGFLRKHFGLTDYVPQSNNFVVFSQYFEEDPARARKTGPTVERKPSGLAATVSGTRYVPPLAGPAAVSSHAPTTPTGPVGGKNTLARRDSWIGECSPEAYPRPSAPNPMPAIGADPRGRAAILSSAPTLGLSSSTYAGRQPPPTASELSGSSRAKRTTSPTRSGVGYDIITLAGSHLAAPQVAVVADRPMGRRSQRGY